MIDSSRYFDYAAATPMSPEAVMSIQPYFSERFYNPSALYLAARENKLALDTARHTIAQGLGARPTEMIFTAGGTEANNMALHGILSAYSDAHLVTTAIEHDSVLEPAKNYSHTLVNVSNKGIANPADLTAAVTDQTVLVSVMYANNEIGAIQPLKEIAHNIEQIRKERASHGNARPLYLHTDACQAVNYLDLNVARLGVDLLTVNAGKIYGPKQCGALYVRAGIILKPLIYGGGQEWNLRSGTENLANIIGFATAWQQARDIFHKESHRVSTLRDSLINQLTAKIPSATINGPLGRRRLANNVHITVEGYDNERLLMELDERGFQVATGSACSASDDEPSHVLKALGLSDAAARSSVRITLGRYTNQTSVDMLAETLAKIVAKS